MWFKTSSHKKSVEFPDIVVDSTILQLVTKQKYLGVIFDGRLIWNHHVSYITSTYVISKHKQVATWF